MKVVTVLGGTGMLGSMCVDYLSNHGYEVIATARNDMCNNTRLRQAVDLGFKNTVWLPLNANDDILQLAGIVKESPWIINCIGEIPQKIPPIKDYNLINIKFPALLREVAISNHCQVIQIGTDCVFSGDLTVGNGYRESSRKDAYDDYGKSKIKGELPSVLRCSIIGQEPLGHYSLLGWFLNLPRYETVEGYATHYWNGLTTLHFAKICEGIINNDFALPPLQHLIPADVVTKAELLTMFAFIFQRKDVTINYNSKLRTINRQLTTDYSNINRKLWQMAGYDEPPMIKQMVKEFADYVKSKNSK